MTDRTINSDAILYGQLAAGAAPASSGLLEGLQSEAIEVLQQFVTADDQTLDFNQLCGQDDSVRPRIQITRQLLVSAYLDDLEERDLIHRTGPLPDRNAPRSWYLTQLGAVAAEAAAELQ